MATVSAPPGAEPAESRPLWRRLSAFLFRHPRGRLALLLGPTMVWMVVVYLGALTLLFVSAFWRVDPLTSTVQHRWGLQNFHTMLQDPVYRKIAVRTLGIAAAVTFTDIVLAFPLAYYAARFASARVRSAILVAVVIPLWSSYLVRVFAWRTVLQDNGPADWFLRNVLHVNSLKLGFTNWAVWITFVYLWLPFTTLPIYAALERIPQSYLEASSDLGGKGWNTFRHVILPLALPGVVAGSIFAFSLTLGDYIAPSLVGNTKFIGNVVHDFSGVANNVPFAAAYALVPVVIIGAYLLLARRLGAFEAL